MWSLSKTSVSGHEGCGFESVVAFFTSNCDFLLFPGLLAVVSFFNQSPALNSGDAPG
jgi:hypothetical protein